MKRFCLCGCGREIIIKPHHKYYGIPKYINGHLWKKLSKEGKLNRNGKNNPNYGKKNPWLSKRNKENHPMKNPETRKKLSETRKRLHKEGKITPHNKDKTKENYEPLRKMGEKTKREKHWNWKGGITPYIQKLRNSNRSKEWRRKVFERDNYTCQECNVQIVIKKNIR